MVKNTANTNKPKSSNIVKALWWAFGLFIITVILGFTLISMGAIGYMPKIEELENPIDKYASQIYSSDNEILGTYSQSKENRIYVTYDQLSPYLVQALVATEDARYYSHSGIDVMALARAFVKTGLFRQKSGGGGSTITQQLAKQLYSPEADSKLQRILQKPIEWVIAAKLERYYTKDEIINLYLNKFDFLNNAVGVQSAAHVYFDKLPKDLTIQEAATLIGMCKNPSYFNPMRKNERAKGRRNVVFEQMEKAGYITTSQLDSLKQLPLVTTFKALDHKDGLAPYFREYLRMLMTAKKPDRSNYAKWQMEQYTRDSLAWETDPLYGWCAKTLKPDGGHYNLYTDGLKIYTTIDANMQRYAEASVREHIGGYLQPLFTKEKKGRPYSPYAQKYARHVKDYLEKAMKNSDRYRIMKKAGNSDSEIREAFRQPVEMKVFSWNGEKDVVMTPMDSIRYQKTFLRSGFMALNPKNGNVKAYVGNVNFAYFQYDMVNTGRRQIGSTIKPFLYSLAMEEGMTPCDQMMHVAQTLTTEAGTTWTPRNANQKKIGEMVSIKWGLQNSDNWVTAYLMKQFTPYAFVRLLRSFGMSGNIDPVVSLALGPCEISLSEMVGAYSAFANKGIRTSPVYVTRIEDSYGNVIASFTPQTHEVFSESTYVKMLDMLRSVIDGGTGGRIRSQFKVTAPLGGKTGTTQENSDGWFMCFSPDLVMGCWVGGDERTIRFNSMSEGQGATMALPVIGKFLQKLYGNPKLGYSQSTQFPTIKDVFPCGSGDGDKPDSEKTDQGGIDDMFQ
ncbi:MAG: glycosyltransferase family 51, candidate bifunctional family beta-glycosyltransferase/PBP [Bacteroidetes bacterium]|nr:glycosyltransferase family 51, candidate bifunctional family beta-glycosyltransferase/PBP [Bacteroidota bacterium]